MIVTGISEYHHVIISYQPDHPSSERNVGRTVRATQHTDEREHTISVEHQSKTLTAHVEVCFLRRLRPDDILHIPPRT